jgi:hypothetical protein
VAKVLDKLIHPCQTAYVPGRIVQDNLRMFDFYNTYCKENNIDSLLISLDAKKAFDSVSHKYLHRVLEAYGFSEEFISTIKLLYKDIKANILVNGYKSAMIKILRSVKQGDALSCALFILCIDPLIRKIQNNPEIKPVQIPRSSITNIDVNSKIAGFADDIGLAINNDENSIKNVFKVYDLFSGLSGIKLNIDKTEILKMNNNSLHSDFVPYNVSLDSTVIPTVESLTICGICFSNNANVAYEKNILEKITKMEQQLIRWLQRPLSLEGKILIVKTFGLSQLTYVLQMCEIKDSELNVIERIIFKYLWNKKWVGTTAPDRIKRQTLKLPFDRGGLSAPDITLINRALKVKQFLRAMVTKHPINLIQKFQLERVGYDDYFKCEYAKICKYDTVVGTFQSTCNKLTDQFRGNCSSLPLPDPDGLGNVLSIIASTDVLEYLMRKKELLIINRFGPLANLGVSNYKQLLNEAIYPRNERLGELAKYIITFFPASWMVALNATTDYSNDITYEEEFPTQNLQLIGHSHVTVKNLRATLIESVVNDPYPYTNAQKYELLNFPCNNPFSMVRKHFHMPRDRFFKYRILQGDIFCNSRMYKFKIVESKNCNYCTNSQVVESVKHLIWDCPRSQALWSFLDSLISSTYNVNYLCYETVVLGSDNPIPLVENLILIALKLIMSKDRSKIIEIEQFRNKIKSFFMLEKSAYKNDNKFQKRWCKLEGSLFRDSS